MAHQLAVPMRLGAFVFNRKVVDADNVEIAPISQPNFTGLQLDPSLIRADVQEHIDLTTACPSSTNSRITSLDSGTAVEKRSRCGVYLHWEIPKMFRGGSAATASAASSQPQFRHDKGMKGSSADQETPEFLPIPNRFLVTRRLDPNQVVYPIPAAVALEEFQSWVVESDRIRHVSDFHESSDMEVECVPFLHVAGEDATDQSILKKQADVFLGQTFDALQWCGDPNPGKRDGTHANLTALASSNPLMLDYQPFNSSVFSLVDNFAYVDQTKTVNYASAVTASYSVIGWHSNPTDDPFFNPSPPTSPSAVSHSTLLKRAGLRLVDANLSKSPEATWISDSSSSRCICHGTMYNVIWNYSSVPANFPADDFAQSFHDSQPLAIGSTPTDALLAYLKSIPDVTKTPLINSLIALQNLLIKQNDDVDVQQEASDLLYRRCFASSSGGPTWMPSGQNASSNFSATRMASLKSSEGPFQDLKHITDKQAAVNTMHREKQLLQWEFFAEWWKAVTLPEGGSIDDTAAREIIAKLATLGGDTPGKMSGQLGQAASDISNSIHALQQKLSVQHATEEPFYCSKDPTLLLAGVQSPWPQNYGDPLPVRLDNIIATSSNIDPSSGGAAAGNDSDPLWNALDGSNNNNSNHIRKLRGNGKVFPSDLDPPAYHDTPVLEASESTVGLDRWLNTQPFFPLFLEWEAEYYHVDFGFWDMNSFPSPSTGGTVSGSNKIQYGIQKDLTGSKPDMRVLSGRTLILPQASFSLEHSVRQVIAQTPPSQAPPSVQGQLVDMIRNIRQLPVLSMTLSGFTNHLKTQLTGMHLKPTLRLPGDQPVAMDAAVIPDTIFTKENLINVGNQTGIAPYGTLVVVGEDTCPFKPATHGQMKFTKFNLIDKFGQAVCALNKGPKLLNGETASDRLCPCLGDNYKPQLKQDGSLNTIQPDSSGQCSFMQIGPYINQQARINAHVVIPNESSVLLAPKWRPAMEWEDQIVGWVLLNYPDYGLQFFQANGTFYREIRKGGPWPLGSKVKKSWLPFPPGTATSGQLERLISQLDGDEQYLNSFFELISSATEDIKHTPNEYSSYLQSIIGRPLAVVNMGWSLELATDQLHNQSTGSPPQQPPFLLNSQPDKARAGDTYSFPLKIGDKDRIFDGLLCFFDTDSNNNVDYSRFFFYNDNSTTLSSFPPPVDPRTRIPFPTLQPFYARASGVSSALDVANARNAQLRVFGAIMDPFTSVHGYSGILPVKELRIPHWIVEKALQKMTYFFKAGPLLVPQDVPSFNQDCVVASNSNDASKQKLAAGPALPVPAVGVGDWMWLQPYPQGYNALPLSKTQDAMARFEKAPYTAIEGYLQLRGPLSKESANNTS
ncbi:hypothetical protein CC80DRAFT_429849 [Byssothecium circinans]|uniref:Uncharacterized protein n=1 Tax=Byssothecium circinans TaxID=147558 RepID=A0A6A5TBW1_9PLEO|nr:hypothetical protein CC80DRAFT_429849 [Byssothecium circinans]